MPLEKLLAEAHIVTLHGPLTPDTYHLIDAERIDQMRDGVMLINTSRGALVDTPAVIGGLRCGKIGHVGLDVYEEEADLFFEDLSDQPLRDDVFSRLVTLERWSPATRRSSPRRRCGILRHHHRQPDRLRAGRGHDPPGHRLITVC